MIGFRVMTCYGERIFIFRIFLGLSLGLVISANAWAQNMTIRPTVLSTDQAQVQKLQPTPLMFLQLEGKQINGARLEAVADDKYVFSESSILLGNKQLYYLVKGNNQLIDTREFALPGSVRISPDGRYMIYLFDEARAGQDINFDNGYQVVLRFYHFATAQKINLAVPALSSLQYWDLEAWNYEYELRDSMLFFSASQNTQNYSKEKTAPWVVLDLRKILYLIEGTPTPTRTFTPVGTPTNTPPPTLTLTPTHTPSPTLRPTPTPKPTIPPELRNRADLNGDGEVNALDLLWFERFWQSRP